MRIPSILATAFLSIFLFSCKSENKEQDQKDVVTVENPQINDELFTITINAVVQKDDSFQVYYKDAEKDAFVEEKSLYNVFKGSDQAQDIQFVLPENALPNYLRFDFGINKEQSEVVINSIKIDYLGQNFTIKNNELDLFISFNDQTLKFNKEKGSIAPFVAKDGSYDPMSFTGETLYDKIQILKQ